MAEPPERSWNAYENTVKGATPNALMKNPDDLDEVFALGANRVLEDTVQLARVLVGAHQAAAAIVVQGDWSSVRKYFSLSEKYAAWSRYSAPASGYGIHGWLLRHNATVRLTQTELEHHPEWRQFGNQDGQHPPMRGWLATSIRGRDGINWGLLQLSDKLEGEFDEADEAHFERLGALVSSALEALWEVRNLRRAARSQEP